MRFAAGMVGVTAAVLLAGCSSERSGEFTTEDGETGEYTIDTESGETTASITTEDGTATLRSGADVPVDLPAGFSVYPGAKVVSNTVISQGEGSGSMVMFETSDTPEEVAAYYKAEAEDAGIEIQIEASMNGGKMLGGESDDGLTFSVNSSRDGDMTSAQLLVGSKLGG